MKTPRSDAPPENPDDPAAYGVRVWTPAELEVIDQLAERAPTFDPETGQVTVDPEHWTALWAAYDALQADCDELRALITAWADARDGKWDALPTAEHRLRKAVGR